MSLPFSPSRLRSVLVVLALCLLAVFLAAGCARKRADDVLRVGMELSSPPFEMTDEHNQPTGVGVELAQALADHLHKKLAVQNMQFTGLIPALQTGKIDLIISSMTVNPERAKTIHFSEPYVRMAICVLTGKNSPVQSGEDLNQPGRRIVVRNGTTGFFYARERLQRAEALQIKEESACVLEVIQGKADAFLYDQISVYQLHKKHPDTTRALLAPLQREDWAVGVRMGNEALLGQVNEFLAGYKKSGQLEALGEKYLPDRAAIQEMGRPFSF